MGFRSSELIPAARALAAIRYRKRIGKSVRAQTAAANNIVASGYRSIALLPMKKSIVAFIVASGTNANSQNSKNTRHQPRQWLGNSEGRLRGLIIMAMRTAGGMTSPQFAHSASVPSWALQFLQRGPFRFHILDSATYSRPLQMRIQSFQTVCPLIHRGTQSAVVAKG